jgi:multidrug efflux pump subunit AcrA (membrane-fusion protein)
MIALIQGNCSIDYLTQFASSGYLSEEVTLISPVDGIIAEVSIKNGQLINNRDVLFKIIEVSSLTVESQLRGKEAALFKLALSNKEKFYIKNLQNEASLPAMYFGLNIVNAGELTVQLNITNSPISEKAPTIWQYLPGDQCVLMIPEKSFESSLVLPRGAIVEEGLKRFVFMENGDSYDRVEVTTLFMDKQTAVLGDETKLFEGDKIVISGAYELNIATKKPVKVSGHEGHQH